MSDSDDSKRDVVSAERAAAGRADPSPGSGRDFGVTSKTRRRRSRARVAPPPPRALRPPRDVPRRRLETSAAASATAARAPARGRRPPRRRRPTTILGEAIPRPGAIGDVGDVAAVFRERSPVRRRRGRRRTGPGPGPVVGGRGRGVSPSTGSSPRIFSADPPGLVISSVMSLTVASMAARTAVMVAGSPATTSRCAPFLVTMNSRGVAGVRPAPMDWKGSSRACPSCRRASRRDASLSRTDATFEPCLSRM